VQLRQLTQFKCQAAITVYLSIFDVTLAQNICLGDTCPVLYETFQSEIEQLVKHPANSNPAVWMWLALSLFVVAILTMQGDMSDISTPATWHRGTRRKELLLGEEAAITWMEREMKKL
jgi:hypothetical protein